MAAHALSPAFELAKPEVESDVLWAPISTRLLTGGDRRLEASAFLTDGFGLRQSLEALPSTVPMSDFVKAWMPGRLKGFPVDEGRGLPYLSAGQVLESRPRVRKWLAEAMIVDPDTLRVQPDWLLMSRSGEVGRVTAVYDEHLNKIISDDLLRIQPHDPADFGWLYAYLKTPTFFAIARSSQYGHMIKHLEIEHVLSMPVAMPETTARHSIGQDAKDALELRQASRRLQAKADAMFAELINPSGAPSPDRPTTTVRASDIWSGRRRIEGQFHRADILWLEDRVRVSARVTEPLADIVKSVSVGSRFKRYFGPNGTPYRSASELFDVNPPVTKRIYSALLPHPERYMLKAGWIIMACSGQTYGLLGRTTVLTEDHDKVFGSHDLIRIIPDQTRARTGYLQTVLSHVDYGRPRVVRFASGTSVPHLDPQDIKKVPIPRFGAAQEDAIADLSDEATDLSAKADRLESAAVGAADQVIARLMGRHGAIRLLGEEE